MQVASSLLQWHRNKCTTVKQQIAAAQLTIIDLPSVPARVACLLTQSHLACRLLKTTRDYELRIYDVYPFATTPYERRDEGFLALGSYMEGRNSESARMNLTQPIVMRYEPATVSQLQPILEMSTSLARCQTH